MCQWYVYPYAANWHIYTLRYYLFPRHPEEIFHRLYLKTIIYLNILRFIHFNHSCPGIGFRTDSLQCNSATFSESERRPFGYGKVHIEETDIRCCFNIKPFSASIFIFENESRLSASPQYLLYNRSASHPNL